MPDFARLECFAAARMAVAVLLGTFALTSRLPICVAERIDRATIWLGVRNLLITQCHR